MRLKTILFSAVAASLSVSTAYGGEGYATTSVEKLTPEEAASGMFGEWISHRVTLTYPHRDAEFFRRPEDVLAEVCGVETLDFSEIRTAEGPHFHADLMDGASAPSMYSIFIRCPEPGKDAQ